MPSYPDNLPEIIWWRMACCTESQKTGGVKHHKKCKKPEELRTLWSLPRKALASISSSGVTNAPIVKHYIPIGAIAWRIDNEGEWQMMSRVPEEWLPFLGRR